ncbi:MAG: hypothetical protein GY719_05345 [bacterium]|nr:hypothetical protein [bacterium]
MTIGKWHHGKIVILWSWGVAIVAVALSRMIGDNRTPGFLVALLLMASVILPPIVLSVITWMWLTGKEKNESPEKDVTKPEVNLDTLWIWISKNERAFDGTGDLASRGDSADDAVSREESR